MSDGGGESGGQYDHNKAKKKSGAEDFAQAVCKAAVAQVCENSGFQSFQQSALSVLSDVAARYICELGKTASFYANLTGRTESNVFDVILGLEDLGSAQGFLGASDVNRSMAGSGVVRDIDQFVSESEEIPFACSIPSFPVTKDRKPTPSFAQVGGTPPGGHIPEWLPAFPDRHISSSSPSQSERELGTRVNKFETGKEHRKVETSFLSMQQKLACNGSELPASVDPGDARKAKQAADSNPFLAAPLRFGEKDVSPVVLPPKLLDETVIRCSTVEENHVGDHVSVLATFAPAIEAMKSTLCKSEEGQRKVLLSTRPKFKFGIVKMPSSKLVNLKNESFDQTTSWFGDNNEKDYKKRRVEQIMKESVENPQELAQL
ncbi:hypothetical protein NMG60_11028500 [Bertholletia excelsa]